VLTPFITEGYEGFDINDPHDWIVAEHLLAEGTVALPAVRQAPYGATWVSSS
jgi:N-acylneuraminate cytidylyltransferase